MSKANKLLYDEGFETIDYIRYINSYHKHLKVFIQFNKKMHTVEIDGVDLDRYTINLFLNAAISEKVKRDRYGNLYIEAKEFDEDLIFKDLEKRRYYLCLVNTVCADFIKEYCYKEKYGFEHYNRHYIGDDTLEIRVIKESKKNRRGDK